MEIMELNFRKHSQGLVKLHSLPGVNLLKIRRTRPLTDTEGGQMAGTEV